MIDFTQEDRDVAEWIVRNSETARKYCSFINDNDPFQASVTLIDLAKIGYTKEELVSFLRVVYSENND